MKYLHKCSRYTGVKQSISRKTCRENFEYWQYFGIIYCGYCAHSQYFKFLYCEYCHTHSTSGFDTADTPCTSSTLGFDTLDTASNTSISGPCTAHTPSTRSISAASAVIISVLGVFRPQVLQKSQYSPYEKYLILGVYSEYEVCWKCLKSL